MKHKNKIIAGVIVAAVLVGAWSVGGNYANKGDANAAQPTATQDLTDAATKTSTAAETPTESVEPTAQVAEMPTAEPNETAPPPVEVAEPTDAPQETAEPIAQSDAAPIPTPQETAAQQEINPETGKDRYGTDPIPDGKPLPVEPQAAMVGDGSFTVTLSVRCDTILDNISLLDKNKHELVPSDGIIFPATVVTVYEGESVFNVLQREMKRAKIHMEFVNTPIYNSAYIEGINNLYEFDVGELSGWMYAITPSGGEKWFPNYGSSRYQLKAGDVVEWIYTCDLGRDIGGEGAIGG